MFRKLTASLFASLILLTTTQTIQCKQEDNDMAQFNRKVATCMGAYLMYAGFGGSLGFFGLLQFHKASTTAHNEKFFAPFATFLKTGIGIGIIAGCVGIGLINWACNQPVDENEIETTVQ